MLIDFGAKSGILRELTRRGCDVMVVPYDTTAEQIRRLNPDGIQLSNGPGDPKECRSGARRSASCSANIRSSASASAISCSRSPAARTRRS